jgi:hypothetical protein
MKWVLLFPSLKGFLQKEGVIITKDILKSPDAKSKYENFFIAIEEILLSSECETFHDYLCEVLSLPEFIKCISHEKLLLHWKRLAFQKYCWAIIHKTEDTILNALNFFYYVFPKFYGCVDEKEYLQHAVDILMLLFDKNFNTFSILLETFSCFLAEGHLCWTQIDRKLQDQEILSSTNFKGEESAEIALRYKFLRMVYEDMGEKMSYQAPSEEYVNNLQLSVSENQDRWQSYSYAMILVCVNLLDKEYVSGNDQYILNFTASVIEILMLGSPVQSKDPNEMQEQVTRLLLGYLMYKGDSTMKSFTMQMTQAAHLYSCAVHKGYIHSESNINHFLCFYLDLSELSSKETRPEEVSAREESLIEFINNKTQWNLHQIIRMYSAFTTKGQFISQKKYILLLKKVFEKQCKILPTQYKLRQSTECLLQKTDFVAKNLKSKQVDLLDDVDKLKNETKTLIDLLKTFKTDLNMICEEKS